MDKTATQKRVLGRVIAVMQKESLRLEGAVKTDLDEQIEVLESIRNTLGIIARIKESIAWLIKDA